MVDHTNPFSLVRASDITDAQINSLWVELGASVINTVMEPTSTISKYILGGKGTGKTHLLRYHSYQVARLRNPQLSGIASVKKMGYLAVFLRATGLDSARFEMPGEPAEKWQNLFGIHIELRLTELLLEALSEIKRTSVDDLFDDSSFIRTLNESIDNDVVAKCQSIEDLKSWAESERRLIDHAVNNAAFTGKLDICIPFALGSACLQIKKAMCAWNDAFKNIPIIYLVDEIENLSAHLQVVINTLVRYGEGLATFRISGRLYSLKTKSTLGGEENREGAEYKVVRLDDMLTKNIKFNDFARQFVHKRLGFGNKAARGSLQFEPRYCLEEIDSSDFYEHAFPVVEVDQSNQVFASHFEELLRSKSSGFRPEIAEKITSILTKKHPLILQKLNILLFCKAKIQCRCTRAGEKYI